MKLTCDLCDGSLQMNNDGQGAVCTVCGILYPMARLKEKLKSQPAGQTNGSETRETPAPAKEVPFVPQPFILNLTKGNGDLSGYVQQGGIGLGDNIYINGDYSRPYTIYSINDDYNVVSVKQGMNVDLFVSNCPSRLRFSAR